MDSLFILIGSGKRKVQVDIMISTAVAVQKLESNTGNLLLRSLLPESTQEEEGAFRINVTSTSRRREFFCPLHRDSGGFLLMFCEGKSKGTNWNV